jgi:hypothetical protein
LLRQRNEVIGLAWEEEPTRLSLKDRDAHHVPMPRVIPLGVFDGKTSSMRCLRISFCGSVDLPPHSFIGRAPAGVVRKSTWRATAAAKKIVAILISIGRSPNLQGEFYVKECFLSLTFFAIFD